MWPLLTNADLKLATPFPAPAADTKSPFKGFVYFDAGSIILDLDWDSYIHAIRGWFHNRDRFNPELFVQKFALSGIPRRWSVGSMGASQYVSEIQALLKKEFEMTDDEMPSPEEIKYASSMVVGPMRPRVLRLIRQLRNHGFATGLLSNSNVWHEADMERQIPLAQHFDIVLFSQDLGCEKPETEIFRQATHLANRFLKKNKSPALHPSQIYFMDDTPINVISAREAGWTASLVPLLKDEYLSQPNTDAKLAELSLHKKNLVFGDHAAERVVNLFQNFGL